MTALAGSCAALGLAGTAAGQSASPDARPPSFAMRSAQPPKPAAPDMQAVLDALQASGGKPIETLAPSQARIQPTPADAVAQVLKARVGAAAAAPDASVTTGDQTYGSDPKQFVRIYTPPGATASGKLPVVVYYHGGGWVIADVHVYDATPRFLAKQLDAVVVSVEYRSAPEHRFPAQHEDADAAYDWVLTHAASFGGDPSKVALVGESAGGNLVVNVAIHARDAHLTAPKAVIAVYPIAGGDPNTPSKLANVSTKPLNTPMLKWFGYYVVRTPADMMDPRWNLVKANLRGLPPVTVINADIDPLRDEGGSLQQALVAAGNQADRRVIPGVTHEFFGMGKVVRGASDAEAYAVARIKAAFGM